MLSFKSTALTVFALLGLALSPSLKADQWNKKTVLTVTEAIQLPHTVLEPGTYVFKLADSNSDGHIVQIFNADETHIATILAIPNYRSRPIRACSVSGRRRPVTPKPCAPGSTLATILARSSPTRR
ncbi:MAG: hypothetical protein QOH67_4705 [Hyphomicrobiales bacterium]|nr:hypothetical protein [Hyphomicrobiales bacterium]